jgi:hypothetical protein
MDTPARVLTPLLINEAKFKKRFRQRKSKYWARPSVCLIADEPGTIDRNDTEGVAIVNVFEQARNIFRYHPQLFTTDDRLEEVRTLADYAYSGGKPIVRLLMYALLYSDDNCRRLLILSGWNKESDKNEDLGTIYNVGKARQNRTAIHGVLRRMDKKCPGHGANPDCEGKIPAHRDLCFSCHELYGKTREEYPEWLRFMVRDDYAEHRKQAIEQLYHIEYHDGIKAA